MISRTVEHNASLAKIAWFYIADVDETPAVEIRDRDADEPDAAVKGTVHLQPLHITDTFDEIEDGASLHARHIYHRRAVWRQDAPDVPDYATAGHMSESADATP